MMSSGVVSGLQAIYAPIWPEKLLDDWKGGWVVQAWFRQNSVWVRTDLDDELRQITDEQTSILSLRSNLTTYRPIPRCM